MSLDKTGRENSNKEQCFRQKLHSREILNGFYQVSRVAASNYRANLPACDGIYDLSNKQLTGEGPYILGRKANGVTTLWCYNGGSPASIELGTTTAPSGKGNVVGRSMSNHLEIPLGDKLWRNGRLRPLAELSGTGNWTNISARSISPENGIIAGYATNQAGEWHSIMFLPCALIDLNGGPLGSGSNVSITPKKDANDTNPKSIAWIAPHRITNTHGATFGHDPDMPQLVLQIKGSEQIGLNIRWKLKVKYTRPNGRVLADDTVTIPVAASSPDGWVTEPLTGAVNIYQNVDWGNAVGTGFFGGDAELTYQILNADNSVLAGERKILFRIAGKNPDDGLCRQFIDQVCTEADSHLWFSYAIAKNETKEWRYKNSLYNQFAADPKGKTLRYTASNRSFFIRFGNPMWNWDYSDNKPGGFGIFQITSDTTHGEIYNISRNIIWNWQSNVAAYIGIMKTEGLNSKIPVASRFFDTVEAYYSTPPYEAPPENCKDCANVWNKMSAYDADIITLYNGAGGSLSTILTYPDGSQKTLWNPWKFYPNNTPGWKWSYYITIDVNDNDYLQNVIKQF